MGDAGREGVDVEAEFTAFVRAHDRALRRLAYLICRDRHRAEDIVQGVLVRLFLRWERIDSRDSVLGYARAAVANAAVDESRRPWRRERYVEHPQDRPDPGTPGALTAMEDGMAVLTALGALSPRQRAVIVLRYIEDMDVEATAATLGISAGTVKSQAARGLATLRSRWSGSPQKFATEGQVG